MIWYKRYVADYARKTKGLRPVEHGIYNLMLDTYYGSEDPLPLEMDSIYRIVGAFSADEQGAVRKILKRYWNKTDEGYIQPRAREEIAIASEKSDQTRLAALQRWRNEKVKRYEEDRERKRLANHANADADADADGYADGYASQSQRSEGDPEKSTEEEKDIGIKSARARSRATKQTKQRTSIDPGFEPRESDLKWATEEGFADDDVHRETPAFIDHFMANGKLYKVWGLAWRNWMRNSRKFGGRRDGGKAEERFQRNARVAEIGGEVVPGGGV